MAVEIKRAYKEELYLISGNGTIRTIPSSQGFTAYKKTNGEDFELKPRNGKMNEEIMLTFTNSLTLEITREEFYDKTKKELHDKYMKNALHKKN